MTDHPTPSAPAERTILGMLETTPATPPRPSERFTGFEALPAGFDLDWEPRPLARAIRTGRRFRWPFVTAWIVLGALLLGVVLLGFRFPDVHADSRSAQFSLAASDTAAALSGAESAVALIADPGATPEVLTGAIAPLLRLETSAARLTETTSAWMIVLPDPVPSERLDDITAGRNRLRSIAAAVTDLSGHLRRVSDYRLGIATILDMPALPNSATPFPAVEAERALSNSLAEAVAALGRLPDIPELALHRDQVAGVLAWLGDWHSDYLSELRDGNLGGAVLLEREARGRIADINLGLIRPLDTVAGQAADTISGLRSQLDAALILVGG